jgi:hypothetical protein
MPPIGLRRTLEFAPVSRSTPRASGRSTAAPFGLGGNLAPCRCLSGLAEFRAILLFAFLARMRGWTYRAGIREAPVPQTSSSPRRRCVPGVAPPAVFTVMRAIRLAPLAIVMDDRPTIRDRHVEQRHIVASVLGTGIVFGTRSHQHPPCGLQVIGAPHSGQMASSFIDPEGSTRRAA